MGKSAGREARPATPGAGVLPNLGFRFKCGNPAASRLPLSAAFALSLTVRFRIFAVMDERAVSTLNKPDVALELTLRPSLFSEFTGQLKVKERLGIAVQAAKQRSEALDHILLSGPPGLGDRKSVV